MSIPNFPSSPSQWVRLIRAFGLLLMAYVLVMTFAVPLGPGIVDVRTSACERIQRIESGEQWTIQQIKMLHAA